MTSEIRNQYIFSEEEFENTEFHAAAFVSKYRRVSSLESLREQLRGYSETLKQQLYSIINRDYKDFINIATKLDGVDIRVEHLRKPLVDLRLDLSSLHEGMAVSMEAIQDKLRRKAEVSDKRALLESVLSVLDKLNLAEDIIESHNASSHSNRHGGDNTSHNIGTSSGGEDRSGRSRRDLLRSVAKLQALAALNNNNASQSTTNAAVVQVAARRDLFECSELERAAHALTRARELLNRVAPSALQLNSNQQQPAAAPSSSSSAKGRAVAVAVPGTVVSSAKVTALESISNSIASASSSSDALLSTHAQLTQRLARLTEALLQRLRAHLTSMLSSFASSSSADTGSDTSLAEFPAEGFLHCLRACVALGHGAVAEAAVADTITRPLVRAQLTQGRVDGAGGRGSFGGLHDALQSVAAELVRVLRKPVELADSLALLPVEIDSALTVIDKEASIKSDGSVAEPDGVNLVVNSVWQPAAELLAERFPSMFGVAIAGTFSRCFRALDAFKTSLAHGLGPQASCRLRKHALVRAFDARWRLDLYVQLRQQEVTSRLDRACEMSLASGLTANVYSAVHSNNSTNINNNSSFKSAVAAAMIASVDPAELDALCAAEGLSVSADATATRDNSDGSSNFHFHLPLVRTFAVEMATCLHPSLLLAPIAPRLLELALRLPVRLEVHLCLAADVVTPTLTKAVVANLQTQYLAVLNASTQSSAEAQQPSPTAGTAATPAKASATGKQLPASASAASAASTTVVATPATPANTRVLTSLCVVTSVDELVLLAADVHSLQRWLAKKFQQTAASRLLELAVKPHDGESSQQAQAVVVACAERQLRRLEDLRAAVWAKACALLAADCKKHLAGVRVIAGKYRMTNKPPPETHSGYVELIFQPLRQFLDRHERLVDQFASRRDAVGSSDRWDKELVEDVTTAFLQQVQSLMETVKQMDSALQRRSKLRQSGAGAASADASGRGSGAAALADSEKIALQVFLDVREFAAEIQKLGVDPQEVLAYRLLTEEVAEAGKLVGGA